MTQLHTVACKRKKVRTKNGLTLKRPLVDTEEVVCKPAGKCNLPGFPWLFEVNCNTVPVGKKLKKARLIAEILADRPVIVMWDYKNVPRSAGNLPNSTHYLIITGYDDQTDRFRVFDPWLGQGSIPDAPEVHEYQMTYEGYVNPEVSLGLPVSAVHESDCYNFRRMANDADIAATVAPDADVDPVGEIQNVDLQLGGFDEIVHLDHEIQSNAHRRIVFAHDGSVVGGAKRAGEAFPIVGLTTHQIVEADAAAHRLLLEQTWALIAPIVVGPERRVVDALQMYRTPNAWKEGGHTNARVGQLQVKAAQRLRKEFGNQVRPYLVSIPEQVMFFGACGEGEAARLISLDNDANGPVLTGKQAMAEVLEFITMQRRDAKDDAPRPR